MQLEFVTGKPMKSYIDLKQRALAINECIAVDANLVKSANRLVNNDTLKQLKEKQNAPDGKLDKKFIPLQIFEVIFQPILDVSFSYARF